MAPQSDDGSNGHREVRKTDKNESSSTLENALNLLLKVTPQSALVAMALWMTIKTIPDMARENREGVVKASESTQKVVSEVGGKFDIQEKLLIEIRDNVHEMSRTSKALYQLNKSKEKPAEDSQTQSGGK